jgi:hypothetical protein
MGFDRAPVGSLGRPDFGLVVDRRFVQLFAASVSTGVDAIALAGGTLLAIRRLTGGWNGAAGMGGLAAVCLVGGMLVVLGDLARRFLGGGPGIASRLGLAVAVTALSIPLPGHSPFERVAALVALGGVAGTAAAPWVRPRQRVAAPARRPAVAAPPFASPEPTAAPPPRASDAPPGQVVQQFTRFLRADGGECVRGRLSLTVPAGVRVAASHIGFCPPFPRTPSVEVGTDYDGVEAVVAATEVLPWGVRIECRLDEPAEEDFDIPIDVTAESQPTATSG